MQASIQIAKNLLAEGSTHEFIHKITGLSLDVIKNLDSRACSKTRLVSEQALKKVV